MLSNFRKRKIHIAQHRTQTLLTRAFCHTRVENLLKRLPPLENLLPPPTHIPCAHPFHTKVPPPPHFQFSWIPQIVEGGRNYAKIPFQGIFQLFYACDSRMHEAALFQNTFTFCTFLPKFSNILPFLALFSEKSHACPYFLE